MQDKRWCFLPRRMGEWGNFGSEKWRLATRFNNVTQIHLPTLYLCSASHRVGRAALGG